MMLVELLVAAFVLVVGVLGMMLAFSSGNHLSSVSERETSAAQRARSEIERVLSLSYAQIGMQATPAYASSGPDSYLSPSSGPTTFQYDPTNSAATESLDVDTTNGTIPATGTAWSDGTLSGTVYDFVTWHTDGNCGSGCPSSQDYKRITVETTVNGGTKALKPIVYSTLIPDTGAHPAGQVVNGNQNVVHNPSTSCLNALNQVVPCTQGIDNGNTNQWFTHDTPVGGSDPCPSSQASLPVTSPSGMDTTSPASESGSCSGTGNPCANYATDADPGGTNALPAADNWTSSSCGRPLIPPLTGTGCTQGTANLLNLTTQMWVTTPLTSSLKLTGDGGIEFWTSAMGGTSLSVHFCIAIYDVAAAIFPANATAFITGIPNPIGVAEYSPSTWPTSTSDNEFTFNVSQNAVTVPAGDRIAVRVWLTADSNAVSLLYDNPTTPAILQLNSE